MHRILILASVAMLASTGAAMAQDATQPSSMPDATGASQATPPAAPDTTAAPTAPGDPGAATGTAPMTPPNASSQAAAPADMSAAPPASAPRHYPVCTRKMQDECRNRGGV